MDLMAIRRRLMMQRRSRLPSEYQEVEYIEASGTQYIKTTYVPTIDDNRIVIDMMSTRNYKGDAMTLGSVKTNANSYYVEHYIGMRFYCAIGLSRFQSISWSNFTQFAKKLHVDMDTSRIAVTDVDADMTYTATPTEYYSAFTNDNPVYIFARNKDGTAEYLGRYTRIYALEFYRSDILTAKFIPCYRKSDGEIGMYDTVSKTFYTNVGTGVFLKGADV